jgi:hypothetical protein
MRKKKEDGDLNAEFGMRKKKEDRVLNAEFGMRNAERKTEDG